MKPKKELKNLIDTKYTNGKLVDMVKYISENSKAGEVLWLASPFISSYKAMDYLFNFEYNKKHKTDLRLITDIDNATLYNKQILEFFMQNGELRTLKNLHAKIYIMGSHSIITSANMTRRAFFVNHEIGIAMTKSNIHKDLYEELWREAKPVTPEELEINVKNTRGDFDADMFDGSEIIRELPKKLPKNCEYITGLQKARLQRSKEVPQNCEYITFLENFEKLSKQYIKSGRIWEKPPLKYEIDAFLNYLFHHSETHSSYSYYTTNDVNQNATPELLDECKKEFSKWIKSKEAESYDDENHRSESAKYAKDIFSKDKINELKLEHCAEFLQKNINTYFKNGTRFHWAEKFVQTNNPDTVKNYISQLRECKKEDVDKLIKNSHVKYMGISTSQELIGLLRDEFPIKNENTNAGLRYLGYGAQLEKTDKISKS